VPEVEGRSWLSRGIVLTTEQALREMAAGYDETKAQYGWFPETDYASAKVRAWLAERLLENSKAAEVLALFNENSKQGWIKGTAEGKIKTSSYGVGFTADLNGAYKRLSEAEDMTINASFQRAENYLAQLAIATKDEEENARLWTVAGYVQQARGEVSQWNGIRRAAGNKVYKSFLRVAYDARQSKQDDVASLRRLFEGVGDEQMTVWQRWAAPPDETSATTNKDGLQ